MTVNLLPLVCNYTTISLMYDTATRCLGRRWKAINCTEAALKRSHDSIIDPPVADGCAAHQLHRTPDPPIPLKVTDTVNTHLVSLNTCRQDTFRMFLEFWLLGALHELKLVWFAAFLLLLLLFLQVRVGVKIGVIAWPWTITIDMDFLNA